MGLLSTLCHYGSPSISKCDWMAIKGENLSFYVLGHSYYETSWRNYASLPRRSKGFVTNPVLGQNSTATVLSNLACAFCSPNTQKFFIGGIGYKYSVIHYFQSSCEVAYSAVEPGDEPDLIKIVESSRSHDTP